MISAAALSERWEEFNTVLSLDGSSGLSCAYKSSVLLEANWHEC